MPVSTSLANNSDFIGNINTHMAANLFNKYIWLADVIYSAGQISREEIDRKWAQSTLNDRHESQIPRRTFATWRNEIEELFGLIIDCKRGRGTGLYYIANRDEIKNSTTQQWLLHTFAVTNLVNESRHIQDKILLENMPSDAMYLSPILDAIRTGRKLMMTYQKFGAETGHSFLAEPYCLKTFKQRWYVVCRPDDHPNEKRVYALDRIQNVELTDETYTIPEDFDGEVFFRNCYGIWRDENIPPQTIQIQVSEREAHFLRSLPLHHSQKEIRNSDGIVIFEYYIAPTFDFVQELRTYGSALKVLMPQSLANAMLQDHQKAIQQYAQS